MKKVFLIVGLLFTMATAGVTEEGVKTSPLSIYSGGVGVGAFYSINDSLRDLSRQFLKLSFINDFYFRDDVHLFIDADWLAPGKNFGADFGFDYFLAQGDFRPFMGMGIGARYFDKKGYEFGENFGVSGTVHLGFLLALTDQVQLRFRAPYHVVATSTVDNGVAFDVGILFSGKYKNVKKYDYNDKN